MREAGDDLSVVRPVFFQFVFPSRELAQSFAEEILASGLAAKAENEGGGPAPELPWDVNVTIEMIPERMTITDYECSLGEKATVYNGRADGWYCQRIIGTENVRR
jgi:hypothetical protein